MLQVAYIRENREDVLKRLAIKNFKQLELVDEVVGLDLERRQTQSALDAASAKAKTIAKKIGELIRQDEAKANALKADTMRLKENIQSLNEQLAAVEEAIQCKLMALPNLPHPSVPEGDNPNDNEVVQEHGAFPQLPSNALPHWELATKYQIIDFERGTKIAGAGFPVYKGKGAKLQRALINFFLDQAEQAGYQETEPPVLVNEDSCFGTGQLPDKESQMYTIEQDQLYLAPTAEVPLTNLYRGEILSEENLPVKICAYTPCFRREAGSYGAHVRGLNRLHQFDKVEIVQIISPEQSYAALEEMRMHVQGLLKLLELPFRVLNLCGGDMSFASAKTYDMEVWCAAQARWLEVSSVSNFETFQSNRLKLRYKGLSGKAQLAHTLNGSALALPRVLASLLENNQTEHGIKIPEALWPYTKFERIC